MEVGDAQCGGLEKIMGPEPGWENEWELEGLSEDGGCKGEGIKGLLGTGEVNWELGDLAELRNRGFKGPGF